MRAIIENVSRRGFLTGLASAGGLALTARIVPMGGACAQGAAKYGAEAMPHGTVNDPHVFISITKDGTVTIFCHRSEMGQGVRTGNPMVVADELDADWSRIKIAQAPGDELRYGNQDTDGSRSTRHFLRPMRECGAAARMMLEAAAAERWGVEVSDVEARNHVVVHKPSGRMLGYGELAAEAGAMPVPASSKLKLKDPSQFRYIGRGQVPIVDIVDMTTGRAMYGIDTRLPGMKYAVVARPPVYVLGSGFDFYGPSYQHPPAWDLTGRSGTDPNGVVGRRAADLAFAHAGVGRDDVDVLELYDPFSFEIIRQLEAFRFCQDGEGGPFVADGHIAIDGSHPVTTDGGTMSFSHAGTNPQMMQRAIRAVQQIRGDAGPLQVPDAHIALCSNGGAGAMFTTVALLGDQPR